MNDEAIERAMRAVEDFRREVAEMSSDTIDLLAVERRVQKLTNACGRALMREVITRADARRQR